MGTTTGSSFPDVGASFGAALGPDVAGAVGSSREGVSSGAASSGATGSMVVTCPRCGAGVSALLPGGGERVNQVEHPLFRRGRRIRFPTVEKGQATREVVGQDLAGGRDPAVNQGGGLLRGLVLGLGHEGRHAQPLGVGVGDVGVQGLALRGPQHQHEAIFLDGLHKGAHAGQLDLAQQGHQLAADLGGDAPRPPVGDEPLVVDGAKVGPGGHVLGLQVKVDAQGFQDAPADVIDQGVVAEQGEVRRAAAGRDAVGHRHGEPQLRMGGQGIQVGGVGRLELGQAIGLAGQAAQPVHDEVDDLGPGRDPQTAHQLKLSHGFPLVPDWCGPDRRTMHNPRATCWRGLCIVRLPGRTLLA